jgi:hypothetical protein
MEGGGSGNRGAGDKASSDAGDKGGKGDNDK